MTSPLPPVQGSIDIGGETLSGAARAVYDAAASNTTTTTTTTTAAAALYCSPLIIWIVMSTDYHLPHLK